MREIDLSFYQLHYLRTVGDHLGFFGGFFYFKNSTKHIGPSTVSKQTSSSHQKKLVLAIMMLKNSSLDVEKESFTHSV